MELYPVGHRVLIKLDHVEEKSKGGIIVNTASNNRQEQTGMETGTVIALGDTAYIDFTGDPWVKVGDRVCFKRYEGVYKKVGDDHFRILNDEDIFAKVEGDLTNE